MIDAVTTDRALSQLINYHFKGLTGNLPCRASSLPGIGSSKNPYGFFSRFIPAEFNAVEKP